MVRDWLAPKILFQQIESGEELQKRLEPFKGNPFAKGALDLAWWDLRARLIGKPLWKLLGGRHDTVDVGADFGVMDSLEDLLEAVDGAFQEGFKRVKLRFRPGWDLGMVRSVRGAFPDKVFHIDCNAAYNLKDAEMFQGLDEFGLAMIEQPLAYDDLLDHANAHRQIGSGGAT